MPQVRAEQIQDNVLTNLQIAVNAAISQSKIADQSGDPTGWITKGTINIVTDLPSWTAADEGKLYYQNSSDTLYLGTSSEFIPLSSMTSWDAGLTVKAGSDADNWGGTYGTVFTGDDTFNIDGSNLYVYLNGALQQSGIGNDYVITDTDTITFNFNIGANDKVTMVVPKSVGLSDYSTKTYVDTRTAKQISDIINGRLDFWDMGDTFTSPGSGTTFANRFSWSSSGMTSTVTITKSSDLPNPNVVNSIKIQCTTTDTPTTTDNAGFFYKMEGYDLLKYFNNYGTMGFYAKSTKTGVYSVAFTNGNFSRCWINQYTLSSSWTWIPLPIIFFNQTPISGGGPWNKTNGVGLNIYFVLACGDDYKGTTGSWLTTPTLASTSQVNFMDSTSNEFYITSIIMNPGSYLNGFSNHRQSDEKLRCQRYLYRPEPGDAYTKLALGRWINADTAIVTTEFPVTMRDIPNFAYQGALSQYVVNLLGGVGAASPTALAEYANSSVNNMTLQASYSTGGQTTGLGTGLYTNNQTTNSIYFDAEL